MMDANKPETWKRFVVWVHYGSEGWSPVDDYDTFDEAAIGREMYLSHGGQAVVTEHVPVKHVDGRAA